MFSPHVITPAQLVRRIGMSDSPALIDVRDQEDVAADPRFLPGSRHATHGDVADWAEAWRGREVVVIYHMLRAKWSTGALGFGRAIPARAQLLP